MLNAMIRYSLAYRWFILAGAAVLLGIAAWTIPRMPLDVFPELNVPTITILTEAPGYAAEEVENAVTFPIETALNGIPGLRRLRSSSTIGLSIVWAEFDFGADIYRNRQLVVERLAQVQDILPENIHPPEMTPVTSISGEIMLVGLTTVDGGVSPLELRRMAEFDLRPRLLAVAGVAQVIAIGGELPEYQIEVSPEALRRFDLTLADVEHATIEAHAPVGGGYLPDVGGRELPLRPLTRAQSLDEIARTVVGEWRGAPLLLAQVAELRLGGAPRRGTGSADGQPAVILTIQKNPGTNTLALTRHIDEVLDAFARTLPKGVELRPHIFRQADFITVSIQNVLHALRDGVIFVIIILWLFLLNMRTTFITLTALPLSLGGALLVLHAWGASINVMTLGGIAVAIGSLVDDAIVDVENVFRRLRQNATLPADQRRSRFQVVYEASVEVRSAIFLATAMIVLVFIPLFFLSGVEGRFFRPLGTAYIVSLAVSLVVAMTITPVLCYWLLGRLSDRGRDHRDGGLVRVLKRAYGWGLRNVLAAKNAHLAWRRHQRCPGVVAWHDLWHLISPGVQ